jgi:hypothetical protein
MFPWHPVVRQNRRRQVVKRRRFQGTSRSPLTDSNRRPLLTFSSGAGSEASAGSRGHESAAKHRIRRRSSDRTRTRVPELVFPQCSLASRRLACSAPTPRLGRCKRAHACSPGGRTAAKKRPLGPFLAAGSLGYCLRIVTAAVPMPERVRAVTAWTWTVYVPRQDRLLQGLDCEGLTDAPRGTRFVEVTEVVVTRRMRRPPPATPLRAAPCPKW